MTILSEPPPSVPGSHYGVLRPSKSELRLLPRYHFILQPDGPALALRVIDEAGREIAVIPFEGLSGSVH
jgi:hypothetical protein